MMFVGKAVGYLVGGQALKLYFDSTVLQVWGSK